MKVELLACTPSADEICAAAARSCYSERPSKEIIGTIDPEKILSQTVGMGHHSVIEHAVFTFSVSEVSRALTHQLVRHRIASFSQQSQRYVPLDKPTYVTPPSVSSDRDLLDLYERSMEQIWEIYRALEKAVPAEDARYVLPNACTTNITITMNARELLHFFRLRCCSRAQWEIRDLAERMLGICMTISPAIFKDAGAPCVSGPCPEGKLSCGNPKGKRSVRK
jgi:thymidylate synthase (FAD)